MFNFSFQWLAAGIDFMSLQILMVENSDTRNKADYRQPSILQLLNSFP